MATHWHSLTPDEALARLGSGTDGLAGDEAERRLARFGPNRLERVEPVAAPRILIDQFRSLVVVLLLLAALVALLIGDVLEALAIGAVLAINTVMGFVVELRARRAMDALLRYEVPAATVVRDGTPAVVSSDRLVPGDVIQLEEGNAVPADARLITGSEVRTIEAPLTGESVPVDKSVGPLSDPDTVLAERTPMLYTGTEVVAGRATALVVNTGTETEIGRIGKLIARVEEAKTPLEVRLDALGRRLVWLTLAVAAGVTLLGVLRGAPVGLMIETGVALAIAAVPEGLPAVATIALAVGLRRLARRHALVRRLVAVEALGATTVVCSDKTGTLTAGEMTVAKVATADRVLSVTGDQPRGQGPHRIRATASRRDRLDDRRWSERRGGAEEGGHRSRDGHSRYLYTNHLRDHRAPEDVAYYLCGPPVMSAACRKLLDDLGVDPSNVSFDDFGS